MRVAHINSVCGIRSTGRIMSQLAAAVEESGGSSLMVYGRETVPDGLQGEVFRMESPLGVYLHGLQARLFDKAGFASVGATRRLLKKLDSFSPDILHLHNLHGYYINLPILFDYIRQRGIPVLMTLHDCWTFTGHCSHYDYVRCDRWLTGCHHCPQKREYPASWLMDRSGKNYENKRQLLSGVDLTLVTPSQWLADQCRRSYLKNYPVCVIPNGIDLTQFHPTGSDLRQRYGLEGKRIVLAVASNWGDGRKGLDDVIQLPTLLPGDCAVVVIGVTAEEKKRLPPSVVAIERTNHVQELAQWYSVADVFVNPTREDTFPTVNLEAMACGTGVVTYPVGGSPEPVVAGVTGYVTERMDVHELASLCVKAMALDKAQIAAHAQIYGREEFAQRYTALYRQVCKEKG